MPPGTSFWQAGRKKAATMDVKNKYLFIFIFLSGDSPIGVGE
jgi:hypothetical protein